MRAVRREWLVSVDSLHALRATRTTVEGVPEAARGIEYADSIAHVVREMAARLETRAEEAAELRFRLQLTEEAQSTTEEARRRAEQELAEEWLRREEAERRVEELQRRAEGRVEELELRLQEGATRQEESPRSWWRRWLGE